MTEEDSDTTPHLVSHLPGAQARARADLQRCSEAVDRLLARHGWRLMAPKELVHQAHAHLCSGAASDPHRAATFAYSHALYTACSGAEGTARQNLAYTELFHYLYDSAIRRYPDVCDDAAQSALSRTFTAFGRCRQPGTFLAFALQHLMDAGRALRRQSLHQSRSLDTPIADGPTALGEVLTEPADTSPVDQVLAQEQRARLQQIADEFRRDHPRAGAQLAALWLKYVEGLDDSEISRRLGKPIKSMYVLRSRGAARLQKEPSWRAFAVELGILA